MHRKFTANGTLIPQDPDGKDMCVLFLKYGRCRFKEKCKRSHWVPPLPEEPCPTEFKPPLPNDRPRNKESDHEFTSNLTDLETQSCTSGSKTLIETPSVELQYSSSLLDKELQGNEEKIKSSLARTIDMVQRDSLQTSIQNEGHYPWKANVKKKVDSEFDPLMCGPKKRKQLMTRRFKHIFLEKDNEVVEYSGIEKMFNEAGVYYDNLAKKVEAVNSPQNKVEKRHLKILRRLHWKNLQKLKEKLAQYPPSYFLNFDRGRVNFTRLRPYIYVLVHECLCSDGTTKPVKPSSFDYLTADTLMVYLDVKRVAAQEAEQKLQRWGARPVRARQCIDHLWHIMAISSKSPEGCASEIIGIEQQVLRGARDALDYAHACSFALRRTKCEGRTTYNHHKPREVCASVREGLRSTKRNSFKNATQESFLVSREINDETQRQNADNAKQKSADISSSDVRKKRRRSKQFKNVLLSERAKIKTRCLNLLSTLNC